jgi:hypothetical protein
MNRILAYLVAAICFTAVGINSSFAIGLGNDNPGTLGGSATAVQGQTQGQAQGQLQGQGQAQGLINLNSTDVSNRISNDVRNTALNYANAGAGSVAGASSGGSTSNVDFNITSPKNTPAVFSGNVYPTTNCAHSATVGGAGVGFGFSIGGSYLDDECSLRETARSFQLLNMVSDAVAVLCASKYAAAAPACKSIAAAGGSPEQK